LLNFVYYPVSAILWFWHKAFGYVLGPENGIGWALAVVFLVFTLRTLLIKPFVSQVRSMRKMQEFAPEIQKLKKKYGNDRQKMAAEMQKLQTQHGVNPVAGCLPIFVQIPVFIGLFHVLKSFNRPFLSPEENRNTANYVFGSDEVQSFLDARLFGAPLSAHITQASDQLARFGDVTRVDIALVAVPLMLLAGVLTHLTSRHSVARQTEAQTANPQAAIMNKVMLYLFPIGVVVGGPFFPLAILIYWLSNNAWTLAQQYVIYHQIDAEELEKKQAAITQRESSAPRPGQKPTRPKRGVTPPAGVPDEVDSGSSSNGGGTHPGEGNGTAGKSGTGDGAENGALPGLVHPRTRGKKSRKRR